MCPNCNKEFTGFNKYCSLACIPKPKSKYTKKVILDQIVKFFKKNGRVPVKREMYGLYKVARRYFGTWNNAVKIAGFEPNPVMFAKKYIATDGHKCDSLAERIIDDYLFRRKIKHERNFPYPGDRGLTADFKVKDYWIEFFGLKGQHERYDELVKLKVQLARKHAFDLVPIYPEDLFPSSKLDVVLQPIFDTISASL